MVGEAITNCVPFQTQVAPASAVWMIVATPFRFVTPEKSIADTVFTVASIVTLNEPAVTAYHTVMSF